jgi:hypothetical protein
MALDLRRCGIGNIVLLAAIHGALGGTEIVHDNPAELGVLAPSRFAVTDDASLADPTLNAKYCNLGALRFACEKGALRDVVRPRDDVPDVSGVEAGFCFRVKIGDLDGDSDEFMNERAISAMLAESLKYAKILAVGNDRGVLDRLASVHPNAIVLPASNAETRNHDDHIVQWHALSRCPIVYHGVRSASGNGLTSTFAPVAAAYGGLHPSSGAVIGVDNDGAMWAGNRYTWCGA